MNKPSVGSHKPFEYVTMSFRVFGAHADMIHRAAALKPGRSTASYMRQLVCDWAASDLGEEAPDYTALTQGPSQIAKAAEALGMDPKEFAAYAIRAYAAEVVSKSDRPPPPVPVPVAGPGSVSRIDRATDRPSAKSTSSGSGTHAISLPEMARGVRKRA